MDLASSPDRRPPGGTRRFRCGVAAALLATSLAGQGGDGGSVAFRQACLDATTDALILNVAAHPDDEADRTLVWLRHKLGLRTVTLYSTCGSGGQNAIGREIGPDLARIRVRETLAAAGHTGVMVRWLGFPDFGYSKTTDETLRRWGGEALVVARMAAIVAELDPDVVFTNHGLKRGHGHHRASALGIRRVLEDRARGGRVAPLYQRSFVSARTKPDWECDPFEFDVVRGLTYARQASRGRHEHRTQGPWGRHDPTRQGRDRWQKVFPEGESAPSDAMEHLGSVLTEAAFTAVWQELGRDVGELERQFAAFAEDRPVGVHVAAARGLIPDLRRAAQLLPGDEAGRRAARRLDRRLDALQRVVLAGSGIHVEAYLAGERVPEGGQGVARVLVQAVQRANISDVRASCRGADAVAASEGARGARILKLEFDLAGPLAEPAAFDSEEAAPLPPNPFEPEWLDIDVSFSVDGLPIRLRRQLAAEVEPALTVVWGRRSVYAPPPGAGERILSLHARYDGEDEFDGEVALQLPDGVTAQVLPPRVRLSPQHPIANVLVRLRVPEGLATDEATVRARLGGATGDLRLVRAAVQVDPDLRIGLVRGPDDTLQRTLEDLQIPFEVLDPTRLAVTDLAQFTAVVLDIRAYHHRPDLADHRDRLLEFCGQGGRILSFYHKNREWNERDGHPLLAPYALEVGRGRVSEEDASVTLLHPEHRLFNRPHHITKRDFDGWVQERGLNFPAKWADEWVTLIEMGDTGEKALNGGLLYAEHGGGDFVYCSLALYRQLRIGHRGAVRLLVNLATR